MLMLDMTVARAADPQAAPAFAARSELNLNLKLS
jgi:hypothetical protein